ncbi:hypothetical protein [Kitasatospora sp. NPDC093806]|uniref:hypothetical protein n=1 Tax=Kitasatospora sp. NPDC093806 TaxID=3155075 RepID=UPI0034342898
MSEWYEDPPKEERPPAERTGRRATAWTFGTGCAAVLAGAWSLGTVLFVPWHRAPRWEVLVPLAVTVLLGAAWLIASALAPRAGRTAPTPPRPHPPTPAELRDVAEQAARRTRRSVAAGWAMALPALWVAPVVFITAQQPVERELITRHDTLLAAGARWTDGTVARFGDASLAVHPAGRPELSVPVPDERGRLDQLAPGDHVRILLDIEHPDRGVFAEPDLTRMRPDAPIAGVPGLLLSGVLLLLWWCVLFGVIGRRALLPNAWLRMSPHPLITDPSDPRAVSWTRVRLGDTVLTWSIRTGNEEESGVAWQSGFRLDPETADPSEEEGPGTVVFQEYAARFAAAATVRETVPRLAGATGWLGRETTLGPSSRSLLVLDDGETRWGLGHRAAAYRPPEPPAAPADARPGSGGWLRLPQPVQVFGLGTRVLYCILALWPVAAIAVNTTDAFRRFDPTAVFLVELGGCVVFLLLLFGIARLWKRRRNHHEPGAPGN